MAYYKVRLDLPDGCSKTDGADYIRSAVQTWCKVYNPEDPMFYIGDDATVKPITKEIENEHK